MSAQLLTTTVQSKSTDVPGRTLNQAGVHHYVVDSAHGPGEEVGPIDVFLSAVSTCAVQHVERFAPEVGTTVHGARATIEGFRLEEDPTRFHHANLHVEIFGPSQEEAEKLVGLFKQRCPLYRTLSTATDVTVDVVAHPSPVVAR
jgi:uncharacterized OsmC-like protein